MERLLLLAILFVLPASIVAALPSAGEAWFAREIIAGVSRYQFAYLFWVYLAIVGFVGSRFLKIALAIVAVLVFPMFFVTPLIVYVVNLGSGSAQAHGPHYTNLVTSMLTYIPLSLSLVDLARRPIKGYEARVVVKENGVSFVRKASLLGCRIITHLIYFVLPSLLEVLREERIIERISRTSKLKLVELRASALMLLRIVYYVTCDAIQLIPYWVNEIIALPEKRDGEERV